MRPTSERVILRVAPVRDPQDTGPHGDRCAMPLRIFLVLPALDPDPREAALARGVDDRRVGHGIQLVAPCGEDVAFTAPRTTTRRSPGISALPAWLDHEHRGHGDGSLGLRPV